MFEIGAPSQAEDVVLDAYKLRHKYSEGVEVQLGLHADGAPCLKSVCVWGGWGGAGRISRLESCGIMLLRSYNDTHHRHHALQPPVNWHIKVESSTLLPASAIVSTSMTEMT